MAKESESTTTELRYFRFYTFVFAWLTSNGSLINFPDDGMQVWVKSQLLEVWIYTFHGFILVIVNLQKIERRASVASKAINCNEFEVWGGTIKMRPTNCHHKNNKSILIHEKLHRQCRQNVFDKIVVFLKDIWRKAAGEGKSPSLSSSSLTSHTSAKEWLGTVFYFTHFRTSICNFQLFLFLQKITFIWSKM